MLNRVLDKQMSCLRTRHWGSNTSHLDFKSSILMQAFLFQYKSYETQLVHVHVDFFLSFLIQILFEFLLVYTGNEY